MHDTRFHSSIISWTDAGSSGQDAGGRGDDARRGATRPRAPHHAAPMERDDGSFREEGITLSWSTQRTAAGVREVTISVAREQSVGRQTNATRKPNALAGDSRADAGEPSADAGLVLRYDLPLADPADLEWWYSVTERGAAASGFMQDVQPFAVVTGGRDRAGYGIAVSPATPVTFATGVGEDERTGSSLRLEARVGLLATTDPSSPFTVSFIVCDVDPEWGLRDLLRTYYATYPDYFARRVREDGAWLFVGNFTTADYVSADSVHNPDDFAFHELGVMHEYIGDSDENARQSAARGILPFRYFIPGQREAGFLDRIPETTEEALTMFERTTLDNYQLTFGLDLDGVKGEITTCSVLSADGRPVLVPRWTHWSKNTITFPLNTDPALGDGSRGADLVRAAERVLSEHPYYAGIYLDSLGWLLGFMDYRREHCERRPDALACDDAGRPCVDLRIAAYHFQKRLSDALHARGNYVFANGISVRRPFNATQTDIMGTEGGSDLAKAAVLRSYAFQKPIVHLSYRYFDLPYIESYLKSCVVFGNVPAMGGRYYQGDNGYLRDRDLHRRYIPMVRTLASAGWQPITYARTDEGVLIERFGRAAADEHHPSGDDGELGRPTDDIYFSVHEPSDTASHFVPSTATRTIRVALDTERLLGDAADELYLYDGFSGARHGISAPAPASGSSRVGACSTDLTIRPGSPSVLRLRTRPLPVECAISARTDVILNGQPVTYDVSLANTTADRVSGAVTVSLPSGWSADWETKRFELAPGEQTQVELTVQSVHVFWFREYSVVLECAAGDTTSTVSLALPLLHQRRFVLSDKKSADEGVQSATDGFLS